MGQARFMRIVFSGIVAAAFGGLAIHAFSDDRPHSFSTGVVLIAVGAVIVAAFWLFARDKFEQAHRRHRRKLKKGLQLVSARCRSWSDGTDIILTYSDESVVEIIDEDEIPAWAAVPKEPLPK